MIHSLRGKIIQLKPWELLLDVSSVGYAIKITLQTYESLKKTINQEVFLYTRVIYRETEQSIYGFLREEEVQLFDFLRSLQGVGPQLAKNMISHLGVSDIFLAIERKDDQMLTKIPKVGKVIAGKILFEAENKKKQLAMIQFSSDRDKEREKPLMSNFNEQLEEALMQLGFQKKEIDQANNRMSKTLSEEPERDIENLQEWIRLYLKYL